MQYKQGGYIEESRPDVVLGEVAPLSRALRNKPNQLLRALAGEEQGTLPTADILSGKNARA